MDGVNELIPATYKRYTDETFTRIEGQDNAWIAQDSETLEVIAQWDDADESIPFEEVEEHLRTLGYTIGWEI